MKLFGPKVNLTRKCKTYTKMTMPSCIKTKWNKIKQTKKETKKPFIYLQERERERERLIQLQIAIMARDVPGQG